MAISLYTIATSGRCGTVVNRQTVLNTNGRYDKLIAPNVVEIEATKPYLQFVMAKPNLALTMKKPKVELVMR